MRVNYLRSSDLAAFLKQAGMLIEAGLPLSQILTLLEPRFNRLPIKNLKISLEQGRTLAEGLKTWGIAKDVINLIEVGENVGQLGVSLKRASETLDKALAFRRSIQTALTYPSLVLSVSLLCVIGLFVFILPTFNQMFSDFNYSLPLITRIVMALPDFWLLGLIFLGSVVAFVYKLKTNDFFKHNIPGFNRIYRDSQISHLSRTLGSQIKASVSIITALRAGAETSDSVYKNAIGEIANRIENGEKLSSALTHYPSLFPSTLRQMVGVGEESGALDELLLSAADYYGEEVEMAVKRFTNLVEPVSTLTVGAIVGLVAFAMIMPLFSIMNSLL